MGIDSFNLPKSGRFGSVGGVKVFRSGLGLPTQNRYQTTIQRKGLLGKDPNLQGVAEDEYWDDRRPLEMATETPRQVFRKSHFA